MTGQKAFYTELRTSSLNEAPPLYIPSDPLSFGNLIYVVTGLLLTAIFTEYAKLWYFKGIPPWRARALRHANLEAMDKALKERALELEMAATTINRSLSRLEDLETVCRTQAIRIKELEDNK